MQLDFSALPARQRETKLAILLIPDMRKTYFLPVLLALCLTGCAVEKDEFVRQRSARQFPDPTQGTNNIESQEYKKQIIAPPPTEAEPATDATTPKTGVKRPAAAAVKSAAIARPEPATTK